MKIDIVDKFVQVVGTYLYQTVLLLAARLPTSRYTTILSLLDEMQKLGVLIR